MVFLAVVVFLPIVLAVYLVGFAFNVADAWLERVAVVLAISILCFMWGGIAGRGNSSFVRSDNLYQVVECCFVGEEDGRVTMRLKNFDALFTFDKRFYTVDPERIRGGMDALPARGDCFRFVTGDDRNDLVVVPISCPQ